MSRQWRLKDPGYSAKRAGGKLHLKTHTPLTQRSRRGLTVLSKHSMGTYQGNELTRSLSRSTRPQSSQLVGLLWTNRGLKSGIGVCLLISTLNNAKAGKESSNLPPNPCKREKKNPQDTNANTNRTPRPDIVLTEIIMIITVMKRSLSAKITASVTPSPDLGPIEMMMVVVVVVAKGNLDTGLVIERLRVNFLC